MRHEDERKPHEDERPHREDERPDRDGERPHQESEQEAIAAALAGELRLMDPAARVSAAEARRLLDPEFVEVGASGRR
ncbi:DUF4440 domain-containing protein, partial [Streptomyces sp. NPDC054835]